MPGVAKVPANFAHMMANHDPPAGRRLVDFVMHMFGVMYVFGRQHVELGQNPFTDVIGPSRCCRVQMSADLDGQGGSPAIQHRFG